MYVFEEINHTEVSRVSELLPEALRKDANALVGLLEEYYRYMSTGDLDSQKPSLVLNTLNENFSLDEISEQYLPKIKEYIAPYVPNSNTLNIKELYSKIVKYFYNARGSRESVVVFFKIFFGSTDTEVFDFSDTNNGTSIDDKWIPYTYGIKTPIPISEWEIPYRALIHPAGFRFFSYLLFVIISENQYDLTSASKAISESAIQIKNVEKYFCFRTSTTNNDISYSLLSPEDNPFSNPLNIEDFAYGSHTPTYQPGWFEAFIRKLLIFIFEEKSYLDASKNYSGVFLSYEQISQIASILLKSTYVNPNHHLQILRDEYLGENKFRDPSVIGSFMDYTIEQANIAEWDANNLAQFQNVGSYINVIEN
jgi:hypothetical protein